MCAVCTDGRVALCDKAVGVISFNGAKDGRREVCAKLLLLLLYVPNNIGITLYIVRLARAVVFEQNSPGTNCTAAIVSEAEIIKVSARVEYSKYSWK